VRPLFDEWLQVHAPDRAEREMYLVREMRGRKDQMPASRRAVVYRGRT